MSYRKKLIEVALPLEAINIASAREKSIRHGHPSTLHLWWARRPLAACRAVIFASLVDDPDDPDAPPEFVEACRALPKGKNAADHDTPRQRLFDFIETLVQWESTTDEDVLETARYLIRLATDGNPPPLLDPFAGGGSIPLEAQRLGLEAHASDLNPVAVMICKALIEIPPKFANMPPVNPRDREKMGSDTGWKGAAGLAADVRHYGEWMRDRAWERIGHLYPDHNGETVIAWLWARTVRCPNPACGAMMPLVRSFDLSKKKGKRAWVVPHVEQQTRKISFEVKRGSGKGPEGTVNRQGATCIACGTPVPFDHIRAEGKAGRMSAQLMAIVTKGKRGRNYYSPDKEQEVAAFSAQQVEYWKPYGEMPLKHRNFQAPVYGMYTFGDLFTPRQLVALTTFSDLMAEARERIYLDALATGMVEDESPPCNHGRGAKAYVEAVSTYLGLAQSKMSDINNAFCPWEANKTQVRNLFARQAIGMAWSYAENNVFAGAAGDYVTTIGSMTKALERLHPITRGTANQADARFLEGRDTRIITTDPPYYDNVMYADLSDFFYVWLRRTLRTLYPDIFGTLLVPKEAELVASPHRFDGDSGAAEAHFEIGLQDVFQNIRRRVDALYPLTVFYAYRQSEDDKSMVEDLENETSEISQRASTGWETLLAGLVQSGLTINGTWPIKTELTTALKRTMNALASSIVLVCRPRPDGAPMTSRREFVNLLRRELPAALREMTTANIAPVDLAQASIGPGMAVYSRYSQVLEPNGERLTVRAALQTINQVLDEYLAEQEGDLDADSRFAVAWFEQYGFNTGEFGTADVLARAKNTAVETVANRGIVLSGAGKVRLIRPVTGDEDNPFDPGKFNPETGTVWEATHHLIYELNTHGEEGAAMLLAQMPPDLAADARQLAYRLYAICERKGWAEHARDYNALVISWGASQERAVTIREEYQQGRLFE
jgi:putative DNA methylase